jgi:HD-GYP domain-containing protein (c-di-GMP phosphodiesterase class II)
VAQLLIWGDPRAILAGDLPPGLSTETVTSLADLRQTLDGHGPALVLADARCVEAEKDAAAHWARDGAPGNAVLVAVADGASVDDTLARLPFVEDVLERPVTTPRLRRRLERTIEAVNARRSVRQLEAALARKGADLSKLNEIGVALSAERDNDKLLELILSKSREITSADAGSLYLVERNVVDEESGAPAPDRLRFELAQNATVEVPFKKRPLPLDDASIAGHVALTGRTLNLADAYRLPDDSPFQISRSFDARSGYRTKSVLVVPMRDHENAIIGVVQLINKKRNPEAVLMPVALVEEEVVPFTAVDEELIGSLASQAAVAFENADLIKRIRSLFDAFIRNSVDLIELRDPTTAGHSQRVAILTVKLAKRVDAANSGPLAQTRFTGEQLEEIRYAALLHDTGKVAVQEKFLRKGKKLYATQLIAIRQRFAYIVQVIEAERLAALVEAHRTGRNSPDELAAIEADFGRRKADAVRVLNAVKKANEPTVVEDESFRAIMNLPQRERFSGYEEEDAFPVEAWANGPFLTSEEVDVLSIRRGSLSEKERRVIESHVSHTYDFLRKMPWTSDLRRVPEIAGAHHEKLDGSGYPLGLKAPDIRLESRMMTIADIYDALVAWNRPYKKAVSPERALEILGDEARDGKIDAELLRVFREEDIYNDDAFKEHLRKR